MDAGKEQSPEEEDLGPSAGHALRAIVLIAGAIGGMMIASLVYFHSAPAPRAQHAPLPALTHQGPATVWFVSGPACAPPVSGAQANPVWIEIAPGGTSPVSILADCPGSDVQGDRTIKP